MAAIGSFCHLDLSTTTLEAELDGTGVTVDLRGLTIDLKYVFSQFRYE